MKFLTWYNVSLMTLAALFMLSEITTNPDMYWIIAVWIPAIAYAWITALKTLKK